MVASDSWPSHSCTHVIPACSQRVGEEDYGRSHERSHYDSSLVRSQRNQPIALSVGPALTCPFIHPKIAARG